MLATRPLICAVLPLQALAYLNEEGPFQESPAFECPRLYWEVLLGDAPELASLMLRIYAVPVHSADAERLFSGRDAIKTPARNRLDNERMHKLAKVFALHSW